MQTIGNGGRLTLEDEERHARLSTSGWPPALYPIVPEWLAPLQALGARAQLDYEPVFGTFELGAVALMAAARTLGGRIEELSGASFLCVTDPRGAGIIYDRELPEYSAEHVCVSGILGVFTVELDGVRYIVARTDQLFRATTIVGAPSRGALLSICSRLRGAASELARRRIQTPMGPLREEPDVEEDALILPTSMKSDLLRYLDGYRAMVDAAARVGGSVSRGLLFVGPPGTGKTLTIRHLLTRFHDYRRYYYVFDGSPEQQQGAPFRAMVEALGASSGPAVVVLEDMDHLLKNGAVTAQYLLNVLDGMMRPAASVLWVATSNDPTELEENLLDRPGRFDRIVQFERPGAPEREALVERFLGTKISDVERQEVAATAAGLSGAHLKEICETALIMAQASDEPLESCLRGELVRMLDQQGDSRRPSKWTAAAHKGMGFTTR